MFYCEECDGEFEQPRIFEERHGMREPPFEVFYMCPRCGSDGIRKE